MRALIFVWASAGLLALGCSGAGTGQGSGDAGASGNDGGMSPPDAGTGGLDSGLGSDAGHDAGTLPPPICDAGVSECLSYGTLQTCTLDGGVAGWTSSPCPSGTACFSGACATQCTDACNLGDTRAGPNGAQTCTLYSIDAGGPVDAGTGMMDRARLYDAYLRQWGLPVGQVAYMEFAAPDLQTVSGYADTGDSAIFTGTYLAAQAFRALTTGSPDALAQTGALVQTLHLDFNVSGSPGWLSRFTAPTGSPAPILAQFSTTDPFSHFDAGYAGQTYDWLGHVSRDQYQGVMLGYALAYQALQDESLKELIRGDVVTFVQELMKTRSLCPTINGLPCIAPFNVQYCVVTNTEPLAITINTSTNTESLTGLQEFMPMVFGLVPRPSSAIMLAAAFEVALEVTDGVPAYATQRAAIQQFFDTNITSWLNVAALWSYSKDCGNSYYAYNITWEPMYNLAQLDQDPTRSQTIRGTVLQNELWAAMQSQKQVFFSYIYAASAPSGTDVSTAVDGGNFQLAQFPPPPRVHLPVNDSFPADPSCPGLALDAIDVGVRVVGDFLWQRNPWQQSDPGNVQEVFPGVDYLVAYWMGRYHGFLQDDAAGTCTQWLPQ